MKKKLLQYGITTAIGAVISLLVMYSQGLFDISYPKAEVMLILCDAFFVAGILLALFGVLLWIASTGFFDSIAYIGRTAAHLLLPFLHGERKSFYEYKLEKQEKRKETLSFVIYVGLGFLAVALVFLALWSAEQ